MLKMSDLPLPTRWAIAIVGMLAVVAGTYLVGARKIAYEPGPPVGISQPAIRDGAYHILTVKASQVSKYFSQAASQEDAAANSYQAATRLLGFSTVLTNLELRSPLNNDTTLILDPKQPQIIRFISQFGMYATVPSDGSTPEGRPAPAGYAPPNPFTFTDEFSGNSAGLALGLAWADLLQEGDQSRGLGIYATGAITADGLIESVENTALKVQSALSAHADLVLVPVGADLTQEQIESGRVVEVKTLKEATEVIKTWRKK